MHPHYPSAYRVTHGHTACKPNKHAIVGIVAPGRVIGNRSLILIVVRIVAILRNGQWGVRWRGLHLFSPHKKITFIPTLLYKSRTYDDLTGYLRIVKITSRQHLVLKYGDKYGEKTANMVVMLRIAWLQADMVDAFSLWPHGYLAGGVEEEGWGWLGVD